jgi:NTP pyrophosphatase (non-canonical NTP hydrolase)
MGKHFNRLSPAEDELLTLLNEECAEVIQIVCKAQRHGLNSYHPDEPDGVSNAEMVAEEVGQVLAAVDLLVAAGVLRRELIDEERATKLRRVGDYLHHAKVPKKLLAQAKSAEGGERAGG